MIGSDEKRVGRKDREGGKERAGNEMEEINIMKRSLKNDKE